MKHQILILSLLALCSCKQMEQTSEADADPMLKSKGCSTEKKDRKLKIKCADGSSSEAASTGFSLKDGNGIAYPELQYIASTSPYTPVVLNKDSGHVLAYRSDGGVFFVNKVYFDSPGCTGSAYISATGFVNFKNVFVDNVNAWPGGADALKVVGFSSGAISIVSEFTNNACAVTSITSGQYLRVLPDSFSSSDPLTMTLPLEVVSE